MPIDYGDVALGLIGGLQKGIGSYYDQRRDLNRMDFEAKNKGLIRDGDTWKDDPAALARKKAEENLKIRLELAKDGQEPVFDADGNFQGSKYRQDYIDLVKERAAANPLNAINAAIKQRELAKPNLTEAEAEVDKAFGKDYADYQAGGGFTGVEKNLKNLQDATGLLSQKKGITGGATGILPKAMRDIVSPETSAAQDRIEGAIQSTLKQVLGAQFTEKEGARIMERAFNPRLSEEENLKRSTEILNQLREMAKAKDAAAKYYEKSGILKGFKGSTNFGGLIQEGQSFGPQPGDVVDGYKFQGGDPADPKNWMKQ